MKHSASFSLGTLALPLVFICAVAAQTCPVRQPKTACPVVNPAPRPGQVSGLSAYQYGAGRNGPRRWANLNCNRGKFAIFSACEYCPPNQCGGSAQSPINVVPTVKDPRANGPSINLPARAQVIYSAEPSNFQLNCRKAGTCGSTTFQGTTYRFDNAHLHTTSEHTISSRRYAFELHFVHKSSSGRILVVAVLFRRGAFNAALQRVLNIARRRCFGAVNLRRLSAPAVSKVAVYTGSLTTPPCTEGVIFAVSTVVTTASRAQVVQFRRLIGGGRNNRPVQPLNRRTVTSFQ